MTAVGEMDNQPLILRKGDLLGEGGFIVFAGHLNYGRGRYAVVEYGRRSFGSFCAKVGVSNKKRDIGPCPNISLFTSTCNSSRNGCSFYYRDSSVQTAWPLLAFPTAN